MVIQPIDILLADDDEADRLIFIEAFLELTIQTTVFTVNDGIQYPTMKMILRKLSSMAQMCTLQNPIISTSSKRFWKKQ